uniref:Uncharacterized protein n=1 Tax=Anguilla anguilla TaxID=7936 RepID=A0A0E9R5E8_ANGAN
MVSAVKWCCQPPSNFQLLPGNPYNRCLSNLTQL